MPANDTKTFKSRDLYLAAFLTFKGAKVISAEREHGRVFFCFENKSEIQEFLREFTGGENDIPIFLRHVYDLKVLMSTIT
ncbi:MAG: hypothetical protein KJ706_04295 [Candidatus Omnitrophica bacterium]|nr:hypothetical protein [Candidatus Omnitrophota bacterium]MBU4492283.1 hypothetical protein [Euryarchaeota archaeon]